MQGPAPEASTQQRFTNAVGMEFVLIPAGSFAMGSGMSSKELMNRFSGREQWYEWEKPCHVVEIERPFYLQTTPVTQGQWQHVMGNNPSVFKDCGDDCPVENVSWEDARVFIVKLNQLENSKEYRLPSEAEWEYSCRAGSETEFSFGDDAERLGEFAWFANNSDQKTHPVGKKEPNVWGLYDMHGNVWEWVEDRLHHCYMKAPNDGSAWTDNLWGSTRVIRGGARNYVARFCRSAGRYFLLRGLRPHIVGFRLARSLAYSPCPRIDPIPLFISLKGASCEIVTEGKVEPGHCECSVWKDMQQVPIAFSTAPADWFHVIFEVVRRRTPWIELVHCCNCGQAWYVAIDTSDEYYYFFRLDTEQFRQAGDGNWPAVFDGWGEVFPDDEWLTRTGYNSLEDWQKKNEWPQGTNKH